MRFKTSISLICLLTFGAVAGKAQTLTCTFQFTGSGTIGAQSFTNANITITTVGFTASINSSYEPGALFLQNTSASIDIPGIGTFQFMGPTGTIGFIQPYNVAPGSSVSEGFSFASGITGNTVGLIEMRFLATTKGQEWQMVSSIGPLSSLSAEFLQWNDRPVITNDGYTLNVYDGGSPGTFQAVLSPGVPCAGTPSGNVMDVQSVINESLGLTPADADMNSNGVVNVIDVQLVTNAVLGCGVNGTTAATLGKRLW